ncbi:MAG: CDP-alcohol phosphatidyltransferase family protein [Blastocatellia bacterium]|nr:CDP-alcohol phosphatidyltransferase family protein [Blastocatellia bacterium]
MSHQKRPPAMIEQAVILTESFRGPSAAEAPLLRVATMPILLRSILTAQKIGASKFLVVADQHRVAQFRHVVEQHRRWPQGVQWLTLAEDDRSLNAILQKIVGLVDNQFLLLPGTATFDARLLDVIKSPDGDSALALRVADQPTGIYRFSRRAAMVVAQQAPPLYSLNDLESWLEQRRLLKRTDADATFWQPINSPSDVPQAEAKLDRWLFKETDGIYARLNRKVSIPISRLLIRTRITPNMVSVFALLVSMASGLFFAMGGYVNNLIGAALSHLTCILDGTDGEVARLTFQESEFGCWLETVCDYLYYVFLFSGMVIGMMRHSESLFYPITGGFLLFGVVLSSLTIGYQRRRVAKDRPEKFGKQWEEKMEAHQATNPILRMARHLYFLLRRAFVPYAVMAFALINFLEFILVTSAIAANIAWMVSLYSNHFFQRERAA